MTDTNAAHVARLAGRAELDAALCGEPPADHEARSAEVRVELRLRFDGLAGGAEGAKVQIDEWATAELVPALRQAAGDWLPDRIEADVTTEVLIA